MPLHLQLLVKWEVVSPNTCSRYREFYHEIGNIEKFPFTYWLNGRWFLQIVDIHVGNFYMKLTGRWFPQIVQWESISNIYITKIVVLVSEPVRGRSRATELKLTKQPEDGDRDKVTLALLYACHQCKSHILYDSTTFLLFRSY